MRSLLPFLLLLLAAFAPNTLASLLAIDFGTEWTKASLVKPGIPFDVLLDKDSKRKMGSSVGWKRDERVFGGEASNAAARFPQTHFPYVKPLLGSTYLPENLTSIYPVPPRSTSEGTFLFPHEGSPEHIPLGPDSTSQGALAWTPEELLAMQLSYIRDLAVAASHGEAVTDLFLTVPSYATQHQRRAYKDAADIAGLNIVGMISEAGAVGLNFALTRKFANDVPEYHMIFDSGAGKTTATILAFQQVEVPIESSLTAVPTKKGKKPPKVRYENVTQITTVAAESEPYLGGINIDERLRELLIEDFVTKVGEENGWSIESVKGNARAMRKFWKEAGRVKHILSANNDASTSIESIIDDLDYRSRISRSQLEDACAAFAPHFVSPVSRVLASSGMSVGQMESVIFFGGNTRVPMVQTAVKEVIPAEKIAQNVNTDEAAVLGAAFFGASTGRQFQSKVKLRLQDIAPYEIGYSVGSNQQGIVFPKGSNMTAKETLIFKEKDDFSVTFAYTGKEHATNSEILKVDVIAPVAAIANMTAAELSESEIKLNVKVDTRGFLRVANAVMIAPVKAETMGGKFMGLFGGSKDKKPGEILEDVAVKEDGEPVEIESSSPKEKSIPVTFRETPAGSKPLDKETKKLAKKRLQAIEAVEREVVSRAEARNRLEGYLYRLQNLLGPDASSKALVDFSSEAERAKIESELEAGFAWMSEKADRANTASLKEKFDEIESLEKPIIRRYKEYQGRPKAIDDYQKSMMLSRAFFVDAKNNLTESLAAGNASKYTDEELEVIGDLLKENEAWMTEKMHLQEVANGALHNDPAVTVAELESRGKALQFLVEPLQKRKPPRPPKPSPTAAAPSATESEAPAPTSDSEAEIDADTEAPEPMPVPVHEEL